MVVFLFNCGEEADIDIVEGFLKVILKKINVFMIDVLKQNKKEDVMVKIIVTLTRAQYGSPMILEKVNYYLKTY